MLCAVCASARSLYLCPGAVSIAMQLVCSERINSSLRAKIATSFHCMIGEEIGSSPQAFRVKG